MIEQDYLLRLIAQLIQAMLRAMSMAGRHAKELREAEDEADGMAKREDAEPDPLGAAALLETAFGNCIQMDESVLLVLAPASFAGVLQVSGIEPQLVPHLVRCLELEADFLEQGGMPSRADLRRQQADALALVFGLEDTEQTDR